MTFFKIDTVEPYPKDYNRTTEVAKVELRKDIRPELNDKIVDFGQYDIISLGYPNWWNTMPMAVYTFLEAYDFSNKVVYPFCTHEGSGLGSSEKDIKKLCPDADVISGLPIVGSKVGEARSSVLKWIEPLEN